MSKVRSEAVKSSSGTSNVAAAAREAFAAWVGESPAGRVFGQVLVRPNLPGGYYLLHQADVEARGLKLYDDPRYAREIARLTEAGEHRPLKSAPNLRRGWKLKVADARELAIAMNYLYPAGIIHWYLYREGRLEITNYRENAVCLKKPLWNVDYTTPLEMDRGEGEIPCPEPCSIFVSFARRIRLFEREEKHKGASSFSMSEREDLVALLEAATGAGGIKYAREAEFEEPLNQRRLRYRKLTLLPKLRSERDGCASER